MDGAGFVDEGNVISVSDFEIESDEHYLTVKAMISYWEAQKASDKKYLFPRRKYYTNILVPKNLRDEIKNRALAEGMTIIEFIEQLLEAFRT